MELEEATSTSLLRDLRGHSGDVNCCCWSPVDQTLCSCGGEGALRLWTVPAGKELKQLVAHRFYVNSCAYSPAGDLLATASTDCTVKLWSTSSWSTVGGHMYSNWAGRGLAWGYLHIRRRPMHVTVIGIMDLA